MKPRTLLLILLVLAAAVLVGTPFIGRSAASWSAGAPVTQEVGARILWDIRVPRTLTAFLVGAALALSGMVFQGMFRNPLATPFTLGVSSGASLGAAVYVRLGLSFAVLGIPGISLAAFIGALLAISIVYSFTRTRRGFSTATLLLAGVAVSFFFSSLILFIQYTSDVGHSYTIIHWLMGGVSVVGYDSVFNILPFFVVGALIVLALIHELNLLSTGEDIATSRGVAVARVKHLLFFATSFMVGAVTAVCGPIGFVGMMTPHICRLLIGWDHRYLAPATLLLGGIFLTLCDTLARNIIPPTEIPVGIITALLGGPFFFWLLVRGSSERSVV